jgi:hypothetical protein
MAFKKHFYLYHFKKSIKQITHVYVYCKYNFSVRWVKNNIRLEYDSKRNKESWALKYCYTNTSGYSAMTI